MKGWIICFTVLAASILSVSAELRAGAAASDITPELGVSLDGTISQNGPATQIHDRLHARCLVLDDGRTRLAFAVVDLTVISDAIIERAKVLIEERTGIPGRQVIISATHTHSTPRALVGLKQEDSHREYLQELPERIAEGVRQAKENLSPARIGWGRGSEPRHVHNRRWFVEGAEKAPNPFGDVGEVVRMNPGRTGLIKPAGPVDPEVFVLSLTHPEGRPLAVLANYGLHYVGGIPRGHVSADYYGAFAGRLGELLNTEGQRPAFVGIMSNGTSGDVNANDLSKEPERFVPYERLKTIAGDLAREAARVHGEIKPLPEITLAAVETGLQLKVRKPDAERLAWAKQTAAAEGSPLRLTRPQVYAREALALAEYPDEVAVRLQAFRIGKLAVVSIPCEVFAETGLAIKQASPFADTFVMELANGYHGYLPSAQQHGWGGYETWPARSAYLEVEAEGKIRAASLALLEQLARSDAE